MLYTIIITLIVVISVLLTIVVLLQPGQGQGLSGGIAGGMAGGGGLGARRAADLLSKSTAVLAGALLVLSVLANFAIERNEAAESAVQQSGGAQQAPVEISNPSQTAPAVPQLPDNEEGVDGSQNTEQETGAGPGD